MTAANPNKTNSVFNIPAFWKAQQMDWRITVVRTSLERLGYKMILPYLTLYIVLLGATKTQYGLVNGQYVQLTRWNGNWYYGNWTTYSGTRYTQTRRLRRTGCQPT